MRFITQVGLLAWISDLPRGQRYIIAIAGPPGSGKSTFAEKLETELNVRSPGSAAVLPMDGYHLDDMVLIPRGLRLRKGAPETFDIMGFAHMVNRLRNNVESEIVVPVFDRTIEIARAGARAIPQSVRTVIVEGNYLLLDESPWNKLKFDLSLMIDVERMILHERLLLRWLDIGMGLAEATLKVTENDMKNVDLVKNASRVPDFYL